MTDLQAAVDRAIDDRYLSASAAACAYVRAHARQVLHAIGLSSRPWPAPACTETIAAALGVTAGAQGALEWLLDETCDGERCTRSVRDGTVRYQPAEVEAPDPQERAAAADALAQHEPMIGSTRPMLDHVAAAYPGFLRGELTAMSILFKGVGLELWDRYFAADNPLYDVHNQLAADGLAHVWASSARPRRILELGSGTGGGTGALLNRLRTLPAAREAEYIVSDLAPSLLLRAQRHVPADGATVTTRRLDFDRPLTAQGIDSGTIDVIVAVNALHVARDLGATLTWCRELLAPEGRLIVSESLCGQAAHVHQEFVFNLLPRRATDSGGNASRFLSADDWARALRQQALAPAVASNRSGPELAMLAVARPRG